MRAGVYGGLQVETGTIEPLLFEVRDMQSPSYLQCQTGSNSVNVLISTCYDLTSIALQVSWTSL